MTKDTDEGQPLTTPNVVAKALGANEQAARYPVTNKLLSIASRLLGDQASRLKATDEVVGLSSEVLALEIENEGLRELNKR